LKAVLDASFILNVVFDEINSEHSREIFQNIQLSEIYVPSHFNQEVSQAIYLGLEKNRISLLEAKLFLMYLTELEFTIAAPPSLIRLKEFCINNQVYSYDASYLMLAQDFGAKLITNDNQMQQIAKRLKIEFI
jgi:predicted nucleic acid-binding protein